MVEKSKDKIGRLSMHWCASERDIWFILNNKHGIVDSNACHTSQRFQDFVGFTWFYFQAEEDRILKILDRVMLIDHFGFSFHSLAQDLPLVIALPNNTIFNHMSIIFKVGPP